MKILKKYWTFLPISIFGYLFIKSYSNLVNETFIFDFEILLILGILFFLFLFISIFKDYKIFQIEHKTYNFSISILGFLFIVFFITTKFQNDNLDKSPTILQAGYDGGYNGAWFEFREDGTYKFGNSSGLGATYFRGKYTFNDSLITIDVDSIDNLITTNILAIRNDSLLNIDKKHNSTSKLFKFQIHLNKLSK